MLQEIKKLADGALALQNKNVMDEALRKISALCEQLDSYSDENQATYGQGLNLGAAETKDEFSEITQTLGDTKSAIASEVFENIPTDNGGVE